MTAGVRRFLQGVLTVGVVGLATELLFIGHVENRLQLVPVVLLAGGLVAVAWQAVWPSRTSVLMVRGLMGLFVVSGLLGVGLHYRGNHEFEREMYPSMAGIELVRKTLTGATPVLAPGSMALLGLVGLAAVHGLSPGQQDGLGLTGEDAS